MSIETRISLTLLTVLVNGLTAYWLRPSQRFPTFFRRFRPTDSDPVYRLLYDPKGLTRPYAWLAPIALGMGGIIALWQMP